MHHILGITVENDILAVDSVLFLMYSYIITVKLELIGLISLSIQFKLFLFNFLLVIISMLQTTDTDSFRMNIVCLGW